MEGEIDLAVPLRGTQLPSFKDYLRRIKHARWKVGNRMRTSNHRSEHLVSVQCGNLLISKNRLAITQHCQTVT